MAVKLEFLAELYKSYLSLVMTQISDVNGAYLYQNPYQAYQLFLDIAAFFSDMPEKSKLKACEKMLSQHDKSQALTHNPLVEIMLPLHEKLSQDISQKAAYYHIMVKDITQYEAFLLDDADVQFIVVDSEEDLRQWFDLHMMDLSCDQEKIEHDWFLIRQLFACENMYFFVGFYGDQAVTASTLYCYGQAGYLDNLKTHSKFQRLGLASKIYRHRINFCIKHGISYLMSFNNAKSLGCTRKLGFEEVGRLYSDISIDDLIK